MHENYAEAEQQLRAYGVLLDHESLQVPTGKRKTCGPKKKCWYKTHEFRRSDGRVFVVGSFGTYSTTLAKTLGLGGEGWRKIDVDWKGISDEERERMAAERQAAAERERRDREEAQRWAAMSAAEIWDATARHGVSEYLQRKGVASESCHFVASTIRLARRDAGDRPITLPPGTLVLPLIRYDHPRETALRGLQFIKPDGFKIFTEGFGKSGCAIRLGAVDASTSVVMVCEGYATGLSIRMATGCRWPVYVALDAYNLAFVVEILRAIHPGQHLLVCADDDWLSEDHEGRNPGRRKAMKAAKATPGCDIVWPVFAPATREKKDTDFNDLHQREGLEAVQRQLLRVLALIERGMAGRGS